MICTTLRARLPAALLGVLWAWTALAQQGAITFTPNFREPTDIEQVIEVVAEVTGRTILVDSRVRGSQVQLYNTQPMTAEQVWGLFLEILQTSTFAAVESGSGTWRIVPDANLRAEASTITRGSGAEIVTRWINADNISATQLVPVLRPLLPQTAQLTAVTGTNTLILVDRADNVDRIVDLISLIDNANTQGFESVQLNFASAEDVAQKLTQLAQAQAAGGAVGAQVIPDERTNSIVLTGTDSQRNQFRELASQFDRPSTQGGGSQVRYLNYADAEEVATNLQAQFGGAQVVEDAETAADPTGGNVSVWADIGTNSIVMAAPSSVMRDMLAIIDSLDIPRAQVHIQAIIVEMSESRAAELGLTWIIDGSGGDQAAALTNFSAIGGGVLSLAQIGATGTPDPSILPDGVIAAVGDISDSGTSWAAVVSALQGDGQTNVMQLPELVVLDNEEGSIVVGQNVPFQSGQFTNVAGNQSAINPFSLIERQDVGTTLTITPRINEGTGMQLEILQEVSSLSTSTIASDVITNTRKIETSVFVDDGDILVLGGLIDDQLRENEQRVPGLGNIPGLRWLFRGRRTDRSKSNLMVFIRPTILRDSLDASQITGAKYRALQDQQQILNEEPVQLMKDTERPTLPPLTEEDPAPVPTPD